MKIPIPKEVRFILRRIKDKGHEAYPVGGVIRDWLLNKEVKDWDITTSMSSKEIIEIFKDKTVFSLKHDTVTVVIKGKNYEITPFRGNDLIEDLRHRDFTINAMAYDPDSERIIDPYGGRRDIKRKLIRATEDSKERFNEDPLRMLRAIRISAELGFRIEKNTLQTITLMSDLIKNVSEERIRDELLKTILTLSPSKWIALIHRCGLLKHIIPELVQCYGVRQNRFHRYTVFKHILITLDNVEPDPILRLSALFHDIGKPKTKKKVRGRVVFYGHEKESAKMTDQIMRRLRFSNEMIEKVTKLVREHMLNYSSDWSDSTIRRLIKRVGKDLIMPLISLRKADFIAHGTDKSLEIKLLEELRERVKKELEKGFALSIKDLKINGNIIMDVLGIPEGPEVGRILKILYDMVIEDPSLNQEDILISLAKKIKEGASS